MKQFALNGEIGQILIQIFIERMENIWKMTVDVFNLLLRWKSPV